MPQQLETVPVPGSPPLLSGYVGFGHGKKTFLFLLLFFQFVSSEIDTFPAKQLCWSKIQVRKLHYFATKVPSLSLCLETVRILLKRTPLLRTALHVIFNTPFRGTMNNGLGAIYLTAMLEAG